MRSMCCVQEALNVELRLLGAPGPASAAGGTWTEAARRRGLEGVVRFTGPLDPQQLSDELASCELLLFADLAGASSRKGTLAGSLASGRPVIALDGPRTWGELREREAAWVVDPTAHALADAVGALLGDARMREQLGARGRMFAEEQMGLAVSVAAVHELLGDALPLRARAASAPGA